MNENTNIEKDMSEAQKPAMDSQNIEKNQFNESEETEQTDKSSFGEKFWKLIRKHPLVVILLLVILFLAIWFFFKTNSQKKAFHAEKSAIISNYENQIDSLKLSRIELATKTFSWAVRSDMMRNNIENINELFNQFIRTSDAKLLQLIDTKTNTVVLSTDKKFQGQRFTLPSFISLEIESTVSDSVSTKVYTPIMGINEMLGLLIAEFENK